MPSGNRGVSFYETRKLDEPLSLRTTHFNPPNIARESSGFGQILSAGNARIILFGLKFYF